MNRARREFAKAMFEGKSPKEVYKQTKAMYPTFNHAVWVNGALVLKKSLGPN